MTVDIRNKTHLAARAAALGAGLAKHFPNGTQVITCAGGAVSEPVDAFVASFHEIVANRASVVAAQAAAAKAVATEDERVPALLAIVQAVEGFVRLTFGADATVLADFALAPRKPRTPLTALQKTASVAKAAATRKARGTMSAKRKKAIKGDATVAVVVTPA